MAYEQKDGQGSLFRNDKKEPGNPAHENYADYTGSCTLQGEQMWVNAWVKTSKDGKKYFSLSFKPKEAKGAQRGGQGGGGQQRSSASAQKPQAGGSWRDKSPIESDNIPFAWFLILGATGLALYACGAAYVGIT